MIALPLIALILMGVIVAGAMVIMLRDPRW
jgi:hypothetical protein